MDRVGAFATGLELWGARPTSRETLFPLPNEASSGPKSALQTSHAGRSRDGRLKIGP